MNPVLGLCYCGCGLNVDGVRYQSEPYNRMCMCNVRCGIYIVCCGRNDCGEGCLCVGDCVGDCVINVFRRCYLRVSVCVCVIGCTFVYC